MKPKEKVVKLYEKVFAITPEDLTNDECVFFAKQCALITEEFAIGFAEWLRDDRFNTEFWYKEIEIKELLKIYKKEKGL